jgi:hypothetical protein
MVKKIGVDKSKEKKVVCDKCGSILLYFPREVVVSSMGELDTWSYIVCKEGAS